MLAVIDHYEARGVVDRVDGTQEIDAVTDSIMRDLRAPSSEVR